MTKNSVTGSKSSITLYLKFRSNKNNVVCDYKEIKLLKVWEHSNILNRNVCKSTISNLTKFSKLRYMNLFKFNKLLTILCLKSISKERKVHDLDLSERLRIIIFIYDSDVFASTLVNGIKFSNDNERTYEFSHFWFLNNKLRALKISQLLLVVYQKLLKFGRFILTSRLLTDAGIIWSS